nr:hypothetical protein CFP56_52113 [Quercus suber]
MDLGSCVGLSKLKGMDLGGLGMEKKKRGRLAQLRTTPDATSHQQSATDRPVPVSPNLNLKRGRVYREGVKERTNH